MGDIVLLRLIALGQGVLI